MIALFDMYLRKWLLGLAVTVRNRAQAMIAKMESVEAEKGKGADRQGAPDAARSARSGAPPDHWVRLVKRHAPELLQPGPPDAFPRESGQVPENKVGPDEFSAADIQESPPAEDALQADDAQTHAGPTLVLNLPRLLKDHDDPRSRGLKPDDKKQKSSSGGPPEAAAISAETQRADAPYAAPRTTQAGSPEGQRFQSSPAGAGQSSSRRFLRPERNDVQEHPRPTDSGTRGAEAQAARAPAARRSPPAAGPVEKSHAAGMQRKNIRENAAEKLRSLKQSGGRDGQFDRQAPDSQGDFRIDTSMPVQGSSIPEGAYESGPRPSEYVSELRSSPHYESAPSAVQVKRRESDFGQALRIGPVNEQLKALPSQDGPKFESTRSRSPEFSWPGLPGEKNYETAGASHLNPAWPDLPAEQPAGAGSFGHQMQPHPAEEKPQNIERLRRLDEEQKGMSWSVSRF